ncbi:DUF3291 domain-containing protein [Maribacter aestuarii]|uniref:DUF3291 domain-containing protein n=1 Tax=Maribacter aestuarii TaxID=1130723 RepID=UPI0025A647CE|nr:DUF3291 domain-containing protein [Maribacter aestuarii]
MSQITTITLFKYKTLGSKLWAFGMMQFAHKPLKEVNGLQLYKLMGSGKPGFNPFADWSVYALIQIWDNEEAAKVFFEESNLMKKYRATSSENCSLFLKNMRAKGAWSGKNPFVESDTLDAQNPFIAVITRATIKTKLLFKFWNYVPISQRPLENNEGLLYAKGIGEVPFFQMATFSIWKDKESLMNYAYNSKEHAEAIVKTKELNWYSEELFSRFQPYKSLGYFKEIGKLPF